MRPNGAFPHLAGEVFVECATEVCVWGGKVVTISSGCRASLLHGQQACF